jgi:predicted DCC family thiol-disulfide oxidoreductase YuxK
MNKPVILVYDKQCPLCDNYCKLIRIRESVGELVLIDARTNSNIMEEITQANLDIDQGMVLKFDDNLYYGADAIHVLAMISSPSGIFNRLNYWYFKSKFIAKYSYPIMRSIRNLLLKALSVTKINNLKKENNNKF